MRKLWLAVVLTMSGALITPLHSTQADTTDHPYVRRGPDKSIEGNGGNYTLDGQYNNVLIKGNYNTVVVTGATDYVSVYGFGNAIVLRGSDRFIHTTYVSGHSNNTTIEGRCGNFNIDTGGDGNSVKASALDSLLLKADHNTINIGKAGGGWIQGNDNTVIYQHGVGRGHITISQRFTVTGKRNTVQRIP